MYSRHVTNTKVSWRIKKLKLYLCISITNYHFDTWFFHTKCVGLYKNELITCRLKCVCSCSEKNMWDYWHIFVFIYILRSAQSDSELVLYVVLVRADVI